MSGPPQWTGPPPPGSGPPAAPDPADTPPLGQPGWDQAGWDQAGWVQAGWGQAGWGPGGGPLPTGPRAWSRGKVFWVVLGWCTLLGPVIGIGLGLLLVGGIATFGGLDQMGRDVLIGFGLLFTLLIGGVGGAVAGLLGGAAAGGAASWAVRRTPTVVGALLSGVAASGLLLLRASLGAFGDGQLIGLDLVAALPVFVVTALVAGLVLRRANR